MYELLAEGYTDREMMSQLHMSESTYYWYKSKLYEKYGKIQREKTEDMIYLQQQILYERLTKLYKLSEDKLTKDSKHMNGAEIAAVGQIAQELSINILKLECEGIRSMNRNINNITRYLYNNSNSPN